MSNNTHEAIAPNTPVIIGIGFCQEKTEDPLESSEPYQLMVNAVRNAAEDATSDRVKSEALLKQVESIAVPQGTWQYRNPGKLIADEIGCPSAKSVLVDLGVLHLSPLSDICQAISNGDQHIGIITGGEAKFRELCGRISGVEISDTQQAEDTPAPDVYYPTPDPFATEVESLAGMTFPIEFFSVMESALRFHQGLSIEEHRDNIAELYSSFSEVASKNPDAWNQTVIPPEEFRDPVGKNYMLSFPYTKKHNSQWNVNQAVAIIVCSAEKAKELGLDDSNWIFPVSAAQSRHVVCLAEQKQLHSHPGSVMTGERAYSLAGITNKNISVADLYSCFPSSIQSFGLDLKLNDVCPLTVTGAMFSAGGPLNHFSLTGVAKVAESLRGSNNETKFGLVSNLSGIFGKQAVALFSNQPNKNGYGFEDITEEVAEKDIPLPTNNQYKGVATIVGYTVNHNKEGPARGFVYCDTPDGERTCASTEDKEILELMISEEFVGRNVNMENNRISSLSEV